MSYPSCFGKYDYEYTCFRCKCDYRCLEHTRAKENMNMDRPNYGKREESNEERKERLERAWQAKLPCATCHPKMQRLCKHYNTFKRPDYNHEQFKIGEITCDDKVSMQIPPPSNTYQDISMMI